ncbi:MAG: hypothetical protein IPO52_07690 [Gemmatimonadetes bacterium]|nr:hypothetical protein [Gemmatimonadota bacterium]
MPTSRLHQVLEEGGGRGLPVGAGHRDVRDAGERVEAELRLGQHRNARVDGGAHHGCRGRDPG